jgi:hypothetical protein
MRLLAALQPIRMVSHSKIEQWERLVESADAGSCREEREKKVVAGFRDAAVKTPQATMLYAYVCVR